MLFLQQKQSIIVIGGTVAVLLGALLFLLPVGGGKAFTAPEPPYFTSFSGAVVKEADEKYTVTLKPFFFVSATGTNTTLDVSLRDAEFTLVLKKAGKEIKRVSFDAFRCTDDSQPCTALVRGEGEFIRHVYEIPELPDSLEVFRGEEVIYAKASQYPPVDMPVRSQEFNREEGTVRISWDKPAAPTFRYFAYVFNENYQSPIPIPEDAVNADGEPVFSENSFLFRFKNIIASGTLKVAIYVTDGLRTYAFTTGVFSVR